MRDRIEPLQAGIPHTRTRDCALHRHSLRLFAAKPLGFSHLATICNAFQRFSTLCNALQRFATLCHVTQRSAMLRHAPQHRATIRRAAPRYTRQPVFSSSQNPFLNPTKKRYCSVTVIPVCSYSNAGSALERGVTALPLILGFHILFCLNQTDFFATRAKSLNYSTR